MRRVQLTVRGWQYWWRAGSGMPVALHLSCLVTSLAKTSQVILFNHLPGLQIFSTSGHSVFNTRNQKLYGITQATFRFKHVFFYYKKNSISLLLPSFLTYTKDKIMPNKVFITMLLLFWCVLPGDLRIASSLSSPRRTSLVYLTAWGKGRSLRPAFGRPGH